MHRNAFQQRPKKHSTVFEMDNRLRKSVLELDKKEVKLLTQAFKGIMNLPYYDEHSYFTLASWHGIGANMCPHHDQLFLSWHRKYLRLFEDALRSVPGCETVTLPYWDATSDDPSVPEWLSTYPFDSFDLRKSFSQDDWPKVAQEIHDKFGYDVDWFNDPTTFRQKDFPSEIQQLLQSNQVEINITTAMNSAVWSGISNDSSTDVGIEVAHDGIHDAVGGWMGQPALAAFDPIFWFHHSNVDRLFKVWQQQKNATTVEALNALRGEYEIPWDVSFSTRDSLSLSVSRDSFTGSFRELVSKPDISYTTGSFAKVSDRLPLRASFGLVSRSADAVAVGPVVVTASNLLCLRVKDIDRSKIKGSFTVRVFIGDHTTIDIPAFQKGIGCDNCEANKLFSVHTFLPTSTVKPNDRIVIKLIHTHLFTSHEEEITNFGQPEVDIRLLVQ